MGHDRDRCLGPGECGTCTPPKVEPDKRRAAWEAVAKLDAEGAVLGLVQSRGTAEQCERLAAGVLPEGEILALARAQLLGPLDGLPHAPRYSIAECRAVLAGDEPGDCNGGCDTPATGSELYEGALDAAEWAALKALRAIAPRGVTVTVRERYATCRDELHTDGVLGLYARAEITWAGRTIGRDLALEIPAVQP